MTTVGEVFSTTKDRVTFFKEGGISKARATFIPENKKVEVTKEDLTVSEPVTPEKVFKKLEIYGGCIVKKYLPEDVCDNILKDMEPHLVADEAWEGGFFPPETRRACRTCIKSPTAANKFLAHPLNLAVSNKFLSKKNYFVVGDRIVSGFSPAQHNSTITFDVGPGAADQELHRDDMLHHNIRHKMNKYEYGNETAVGSILGLSKTTKQNGATRFVPGSHLWDHFHKPKEEECVYAELEKGDAFFMLASCYHGGSANKTIDEHRILTILFMTQGTLRQEENIFLETPIEYFKSLSTEALEALGLTTSEPFCGFYELKNPMEFLKEGYKDVGDDDLFTDSYQYTT
ncbi:Piso0_000607 [Millerozyma farinosa CBS 7064]|uniref:Piso0_000607 protein n=1 Tax=Pichia sorbitophila (strain ATCC MYA-4447 / BCRC 22081 / CBS 7064 / NBRC 10061 / NRRL Y-12695) TaxID=559304 RepID=G8YPJ8_PICSO|nr:Piso0_000607 [Millerozyma farinosa CBS 7064]